MDRFITLEGPDGAGKSSQQRLLAARLEQMGCEVVATREPGGTSLGERVRSILLAAADANEPHDPMADALLFNAARRQLVDNMIRPALDRGAVVLCDRFADSTLAYQGYGAGAPLEALAMLAVIATDSLSPTRTVLLDLSVEDGLARRHGGSPDELTRFETGASFDLDFHRRVRAGYVEMAAREPDRWRVVDASGAPDDVAQGVWAAVRDLFEDEAR